MEHAELRERVCGVNRDLGRAGLAALTWGNASGVDRQAGVIAIKPSGVDYASLTPADIVIVSLDSGKSVDGSLRPSSDTPTHWHLYRAFAAIGGVVHTHSRYATAWAQAKREIPCFGTTHADLFHGPVPITRDLTEREVQGEYELNTGRVIEERFNAGRLNPAHVPGVLVASHAPFTWGPDSRTALENAMALEEIARMALDSLSLQPGLPAVSRYLLDKHFLRKHGAGAYYGQPKQAAE
jgi:L-ribulose-5-phosphate 4-epimerase